MLRFAPNRLNLFLALSAPFAVAGFWGCASGTSDTPQQESSTTVSSSSSTAQGTGGFVVNAGGGGSGGSDGGGGSTACTSTSAEAHRVPIDIVFLIDRSASMSGTKWMGTTSALTTFFNDPASAGIGAGIVYMPTDTPYDCDPTHYEVLTEPVSALPASAFELTNSMPADATGEGTPMYGALKGALFAATAYQDANPTHKVNVVLATDGEPNGCSGFSVTSIANLAQGAFDYDGVHTYVIGCDGAVISTLDQIAAAGGTGSAYDVTQDITQFSAKMAEIRTQALGCEFEVPPPPDGMMIDPGKVNFTYTPGGVGAPELLPRALDLADCIGEPGWYFDDNSDPKEIIMCPASCTTVQNDGNAKVDVLFGCASVLR
jgi:hypothetical protein